jgi:putative ABC transport system ATP-binding protein
MPIVEVRNLTKVFSEAGRDRTVLCGLDLCVENSSLVVLLGRSGSGKSTLLNLLAGIDLPDGGEVRVAGVSVPQLSERERTLFRRRHIGLVFQFFNLIPTLTVFENLLLPLQLNGRGGREADRAALRLLEQVDLSGRAGSFPDLLSGGEQQRVAIARALVHGPDLVLADEPTGNLDLETGRQVLAILDDLTRRAGKTLLMVTHSPEVVGLADRVLTLREGRLLEGDPGAGGG